MASFDFIESGVRAYDFAWQKRDYLMRASVPVIFVKMACLLAIFTLRIEDDFLLKGLILIPGHIVEALLAIGVVRYYLYAEPIFIWGKPLPLQEQEERPLPLHGAYSRLKSIKSAVAMYLLIKIILLAMIGILSDGAKNISESPPPAEASQDFSVAAVIAIFFLLNAFILSFRFLWMYIPLAMGVSLRVFMRAFAGLQIGVGIFFTWFICCIPFVFFAGFAMVFIEGMNQNGALHIVVSALFESTLDTSMLVVQIIGITYGMHSVLSGKTKNGGREE